MQIPLTLQPKTSRFAHSADMGSKDLATQCRALQNSLFTVSLYDNDLLVAFGVCG